MKIDAVFQRAKTGHIFVFSGENYYRLNPKVPGLIEPGYPKPIAGNWPGVNFKRIDVAFQRSDTGKVFLFSGQEYIRFDLEGADAAEPGFPKPIPAKWADIFA